MHKHAAELRHQGTSGEPFGGTLYTHSMISPCHQRFRVPQLESYGSSFNVKVAMTQWYDGMLSMQAWVKLGLAEGGRLRSKKLPSVALELIVLQAYEQEVEASGCYR